MLFDDRDVVQHEDFGPVRLEVAKTRDATHSDLFGCCLINQGVLTDTFGMTYSEEAARAEFEEIRRRVAWEYANMQHRQKKGETILPYPKKSNGLNQWLEEQEIAAELIDRFYFGKWLSFDDKDDAFHYKMRWL